MKHYIILNSVLLALAMGLACPTASFAGLKRDPIEETKSKSIPVTEELLKREGESGPASPTFKIDDTSKFLAKKPYQPVDEEEIGNTEAQTKPSSWWDEWFSEPGEKTAEKNSETDSGEDSVTDS